jgi:RNA-directed DNA polymerase
VRHPELRWLMETVLFHDPTRDYRFRSLGGRVPGPESAGYPVPTRKSLFNRGNQRGLPIGNLTSQFWANVYLNELDQFAKRTLRCRFYVRYVDDVLVLSSDRSELLAVGDQIRAFLGTVLQLELREPRSEPAPVGEGVEFVGWRTWWSHHVARRQTLGNLRRRLEGVERRHLRRAFAGLAWRIELAAPRRPLRRVLGDPAAGGDPARLPSVVASYGGHLRHGAAWNDWRRIWQRYVWLSLLFDAHGWGARFRWRPHGRAPRFATRYRRLLRSPPAACLLFLTVGRYVEFYGPQRLLAQRVLGLRPIRRPRAGYALSVGFPYWLAARFAERALRSGVAVALVRQEGPPAALLAPRGAGRAQGETRSTALA